MVQRQGKHRRVDGRSVATFPLLLPLDHHGVPAVYSQFCLGVHTGAHSLRPLSSAGCRQACLATGPSLDLDKVKERFVSNTNLTRTDWYAPPSVAGQVHRYNNTTRGA